MNTLRIVAPSLVHLLHIVARGAGQVALLRLEHVLPLHLSSISRVQGSTIPFNIIRLFVTGNDYHLRLNACKLAPEFQKQDPDPNLQNNPEIEPDESKTPFLRI